MGDGFEVDPPKWVIVQPEPVTPNNASYATGFCQEASMTQSLSLLMVRS